MTWPGYSLAMGFCHAFLYLPWVVLMVYRICVLFFFLAMFAPIPLGTFDLTYGGTYGSCLACLLFGLKPSGWERLL